MRQWQPILRSAAAFLSTLDARFARRILLAATCLSRTSFNEALWSGENNFVISQERARYRDREGADADTAAKTHQDPTIQQTDPDIQIQIQIQMHYGYVSFFFCLLALESGNEDLLPYSLRILISHLF